MSWRSNSNDWRQMHWEEAKEILAIAGPIIVSQTLNNLMNITDLVMVGHIGKDQLAAAAIGNTVFNLVAFPLVGMMTALNTLGSNSFGAKDYDSLRHWIRVTCSLMLVFCCLGTVLLLNAGLFIDSLFSQPHNITGEAADFCMLLIPGFWGLVFFCVLQSALQCQKILMPLVYIALLSNVINVAGNFLCIWGLNMGLKGSPVATSFSRLFMVTVTVCYIVWRDKKKLGPHIFIRFGSGYQAVLNSEDHSDSDVESNLEAKPEHLANDNMVDSVNLADDDVAMIALTHQETSESNASTISEIEEEDLNSDDVVSTQHSPLRSAITFLKLGLPGALMLMAEAFSFEVTTIFATRLGTVALDAHVLLLSLCGFLYVSVPLSISIAISVRVGNLMGEQNAEKGRLAARVALVLGGVANTLVGIALVSLGRQIGQMFTTEEQVIERVAHLIPVATLFMTADGVQSCAQGVLNGVGKQQIIAGMNFLALWAVGVPVGHALAFNTSVGLAGLWWGFVIGLSILCVVLCIMISRLQWSKECAAAQKRISS